MLVQNQNSIQTYYQTNTANKSNNDNPTTEATKGILQNDSVTISHQAQNVDKKWQNIATKYDVNNMSRTDRGNLVNDLSENGLITNQVSMQILAPVSMSEGLNDKSNFLGTMKKSYEFNKGAGVGTDYLKAKLEAIEVLEKLKALE